MPGFTPVAEVRAELLGRVGHRKLMRGGLERFAFGVILSFSGDFTMGSRAHGPIKERERDAQATNFAAVRPVEFQFPMAQGFTPDTTARLMR
jgi:hypothetical protein